MTDSASFLSTQFLPTFIDAYRNHPSLWLTKCPEYSNRKIKAAAYRDLIQLTKKTIPNCDLNFIRKKIEVLRGSFRREHKKVRAGSGQDGDVYKPKLWYYNLLLFLKDQEETGQTTVPPDPVEHVVREFQEVGTCKVEEADEYDTFEAETVSAAATPTHELQKRPRFETEESSVANLLPPPEVSFLHHHQQQEDEFDKFGAVVAAKLRRMTPLQDIYAEHLINQVLFYGMMDRLQETSTIELRESPCYNDT